MAPTRMFYQAEVEAGVELLDREEPDWALNVVLDKLGMANIGGGKCVLAQVFGSYKEGLKRLNLTGIQAKRYGFDISFFPGIFTGIIAFPVLTAAWKTEIESRQHSQAAA